MEKALIYFDNAATVWPKPENVYRFMDEFYRSHGVNPGRSGYDLAMEAGSLLDRLRKRMTKFFGGDEDASDRLVFGYNVTDALNLIIPGLVSSGDHVITTNLEHNSVIRPVNHMVRDHGAEATFVPFDSAGFVDPDDIARAMRPNTRLVIVNHGSNVLGTVQPVKEIGRICRERGVTFVVDTAQTAGVIPINMKEMNIDVVAFTGHKALMGSMGIGGLCIRKHVEVKQRAQRRHRRALHPSLPPRRISLATGVRHSEHGGRGVAVGRAGLAGRERRREGACARDEAGAETGGWLPADRRRRSCTAATASTTTSRPSS